ncbi:MAG: transcriptional regulator [Rhodobacterales bacterium]|nr:MAG: transcriptional regulator [Rhodobacterales bacterium]
MKHESHILVCPPIAFAASAFAALGSEQRLSVLRTLVRAGPGGLSVGELGRRSGISGSTLSHHLRILVSAGLVTQEKRGRSIIAGAADMTTMQALSDYLLSECCADAAPDITPEKVHDHG